MSYDMLGLVYLTWVPYLLGSNPEAASIYAVPNMEQVSCVSGPKPVNHLPLEVIHTKLMCISLNDVNFGALPRCALLEGSKSSDWTAKPIGFAVKSKGLVEPSGIEPLTS